jgi:hypothetical protein
MIAIVVIHAMAIMWFGVLAQDRAMWKLRRMRLEAEYTGNFDEAIAWMNREDPRIYARGIAAVVLALAMGVLVVTGVYS